MEVFRVCSFTTHPDVTLRTKDGQTFRFEFSTWFGPMMLGTRGQPVAAMPPKRSPFWRALQLWCRQGHQLTPRGEAIYDEPPPRRYVRLAGRQHVEVPPGSDPAEVRRRLFERLNLPVPDEPVEVIEVEGGIDE